MKVTKSITIAKYQINLSPVKLSDGLSLTLP